MFRSTIRGVGVEWADSAAKHGIAREDALHAMLNAYVYRPGFDKSRKASASRPDLWVGPPRRLGGPLIEVMAERIPPRGLQVFHVMEANAERKAMVEQAQGQGRRQ